MENRNTWIDLLKACAIFCVICAHIGYDIEYVIEGHAVLEFYSKLGKSGVPLFLIIAGYMYAHNTDLNLQFWKKKIVRLVPPWILCSLIVYLQCFQLYNPKNWMNWYSQYVKNFSCVEYAKFFIGVGSLYYYMPIIFLCFLLFRMMRRCRWLEIGIGVTFVAVLVMDAHKWDAFFMTPYLNPLNYWGYFAIGLLVARYFGKNIDIWCDTHRVPGVMDRIMGQLGRDSFYIYLLHMLMQSVPIKYLAPYGAVGAFLRPFLLVVLTEVMIVVVRLACSILAKVLRGRNECTIFCWRL